MNTQMLSEVKNFAVKWTPRFLAIGVGGYYGLGLAYEFGLMAVIDRVAMVIIKSLAGTAGLGAFMPVFQWYSSIGVRVVAALSAGILYDLTERLFNKCLQFRPA